MAIVRDGLDHLDATWPDAEKLKDSYLKVLPQRMYALHAKKDYKAVLTTFARYSDICRADKDCLDSVGVAYVNLSLGPLNAGDWRTARQVLRECVSDLPGEVRCADLLRDLESSHRF
jgi:hypothetical protein